MNKRNIVRVAERIPGLRQYVKIRRLETQKRLREEENNNLKNSVQQLEQRGEEWAAEVRELRGENKPRTIIWPVSPNDLNKAKWYKKITTAKPTQRSTAPFIFNWVVPPMGETSGGHTTIFRIIHFLESKGHVCRIYFYDPLITNTLETLRENMKTNYPQVKAEVFHNQTSAMAKSDGIFATSWHTAYPVFNAKTTAKKFYLVQDFEPFFDPIGSYSTLAENTYHFGLHAITIGSWLAEKLSTEYGMQCDSFEFGVNTSEYNLVNTKPRKKILFYARPVTPRRGFELGVLALEIFHKQHPEYEINFLGWDTSKYQIPFKYVNNGILKTQDLNVLYNECAAGLVLSFTNMSLLPLELAAAGCVPVVNDARHTRMVAFNKNIEYTLPAPQAIANRLHEVVTAPDVTEKAKIIAKNSSQYQWGGSYEKIEQVITRQLLQ